MSKKETTKNGIYLGIDVGSVSVGLALINSKEEVLKTVYEFHNGNVSECLGEMLGSLELSRITNVGYTHKSGEFFNIPIFP